MEVSQSVYGRSAMLAKEISWGGAAAAGRGARLGGFIGLSQTWGLTLLFL